MPNKNRPRRTARLGPQLDKSLRLYAAVASASGVAVLALAQPTHAEIVFTPTHLTLNGTSISFDLNGDGVNDFTISAGFYRTTLGNGSLYSIGGIAIRGALPSNQARASSSAFTPALQKGVTISSQNLFGGYKIGYCFYKGGVFFQGGGWANHGNHFLGLKFTISGETHFGWARLNVKYVPGTHCEFRALLSGYAYETVANKPIATGQTAGPVAKLRPADDSPRLNAGLSNLGILAQGARGLMVWRRQEEAPCVHASPTTVA